MKISERFGLGKKQWELDFVDIDPAKDLALFLDPSAIATCPSTWAEDAHATIQNFFGYLIKLLRANKVSEANDLFQYLGEPNETCLGLSKGRPRGHGVGRTYAKRILQQIIKSKAITSGLVEDLQDCLIFVDKFGPDLLSDMTTNIIRGNLIAYTQAQCDLWGIELREAPSGFFWDPVQYRWRTEYTRMLVADNKKLLLVPKVATSYCNVYTYQRFHQHFVLNFLQRDHLDRRTSLVQHRRDRHGNITDSFVTKVSLIENGAKLSKDFLRTFTLKHVDVFHDFKSTQDGKTPPLENAQILSKYVDDDSFDETEELKAICAHLSKKLREIPAGKAHADAYVNHMIGVLELLLYPHLMAPEKEVKVNQGRKRIDFVFQNSAKSGLFHDLRETQDIPCRFIPIECKNYTEEIANEELDQLAMRFTKNRGMVGFLLCRQIEKPKVLLERCRDAWTAEEKVMLCLSDYEVHELLKDFGNGDRDAPDRLLRKKYREVAFS